MCLNGSTEMGAFAQGGDVSLTVVWHESAGWEHCVGHPCATSPPCPCKLSYLLWLLILFFLIQETTTITNTIMKHLLCAGWHLLSATTYEGDYYYLHLQVRGLGTERLSDLQITDRTQDSPTLALGQGAPGWQPRSHLRKEHIPRYHFFSVTSGSLLLTGQFFI